jgi:hypothetical protein
MMASVTAPAAVEGGGSGSYRAHDRFAAATQARPSKIKKSAQFRRRMPSTRVEEMDRQLIAFVRREQSTQ